MGKEAGSNILYIPRVVTKFWLGQAGLHILDRLMIYNKTKNKT